MKSLDPFLAKYEARSQELQTSFCLGLDPEWEKLPSQFHLSSQSHPLFSFCQAILEEAGRFASSFKPNIAFFERFGSVGFVEWEMLIDYLRSKFPQTPIIADCKRGDLANTAKEYASYYFDRLQVDSITLSPYMGRDSLVPFLEKGSIFLLCHTSNPSSADFQKLLVGESQTTLYQEVARFASQLDKDYPGRVGIVVGATHPKELAWLRNDHPKLPFLVPGFGAQGGSLENIAQAGGRLSILNASRSVIFASTGEDFAKIAGQKAKEIASTIQELIPWEKPINV